MKNNLKKGARVETNIAVWRKLKQRINEEESEVVTFCHGLKLPAPDGKMRLTGKRVVSPENNLTEPESRKRLKT